MSISPETTDNALFEALFERALEVSPELEKDLKAVGFDRQRPRARYPSRVLFDALEVARRHHMPMHQPDDGMRQLGHAFVSGFRETILGKVMTAALPLLGPRVLLSKVPGRLQRLRSDMAVELKTLGEGHFAFDVRDPVPVGTFFAGVVQAALGIAGAKDVKVGHAVRPGGYTLDITFTA